MPVGDDVMVPVPVPDRVAVSVMPGWNVAVTDRVAVIATTQVVVPVQAPVQPVNTLVDPGVAVNVTLVPAVNVREQVVPHEMPVGLDVTVPVPVPDRVTVRV
jgi:hypothetical protein